MVTVGDACDLAKLRISSASIFMTSIFMTFEAPYFIKMVGIGICCTESCKGCVNNCDAGAVFQQPIFLDHRFLRVNPFLEVADLEIILEGHGNEISAPRQQRFEGGRNVSRHDDVW